MILKGKKIILAVTGSIAAYKTPHLVRLLKKEGAEVQVLLTPAALDFVTPLTLSTLSQRPAHCLGFDPDTGAWNSHVELGNWADIMLIAPVTANTLGKLANGLADNLVVATYLAAKCPVYFAPAMDLDMYRHPTTRENIRKLASFGNKLIEPRTGELASGLCGAGRMEEPEVIVEIISAALKKKVSLKDKKVLVTAGPTYEAIDPVRYIANHSTGTMGFEIAREAAERGAEVTLIAGPVNLDTPHPAIIRKDVVTAAEMEKAVKGLFPRSDIIIMAAAVADYRPAKQEKHKIKKGKTAHVTLELEATGDILAGLGSLKHSGQLVIGFALETNEEKSNALKKLKNKNLDFIVLNSLNDEGAGFGHATNKVTLFSRTGKEKVFGLKSKKEVAGDIFSEIEKMMK